MSGLQFVDQLQCRTTQLVSANRLAAQPDLLPDRTGVYVIAGRAIIPVLHREGYYSSAGSCHAFWGMDAIAYIGCAFRSSIRKRIGDHLFGDSRKSTFRQSLGILLTDDLGLSPIGVRGQAGFHFGEGEADLSIWIQSNLWFAYQATDKPIELERALVRAGNPPFNIKERERDPFARALSARRQAVSRPPTVGAPVALSAPFAELVGEQAALEAASSERR